MTGLRGRNVTVVGLARSGVGAANLLSEFGADVTATDLKTKTELEDFIPMLSPSVKLALGSHPESIFSKADIIVVSPGVRLDIPSVLFAKSRGIPILGELEVAYETVTDGLDNPVIPPLLKGSAIGVLAVTGTNGKSTTTALLDFTMRKGGFRTILGGNIGNALTEEIRKLSHASNFAPNTSRLTAVDFIVAEISSFQLESIRDFRPKGAAIINITPDHLDRYHSLEEYGNAKARIFENQKEGEFLVLNLDDPGTMNVVGEKLNAKSERPKIFYFSRKEEVEGIYFRDGRLYCNLPDSPTVPPNSLLINADEIKIKGVHNLENAMAASAMALLAGCPVEAVIDSLKEFAGLEHRLEFVRELNGVRYFNDSKGTNVGAVMKSLESFSVPIILIAGGRDKAGDFSQLKQLVKQRVKALVLIGESAEKIKKTLGDVVATVVAEDLKEAVQLSQSAALEGDIVLLSPACASFDMFTDFEDRGRQFKRIVMGLR